MRASVNSARGGTSQPSPLKDGVELVIRSIFGLHDPDLGIAVAVPSRVVDGLVSASRSLMSQPETATQAAPSAPRCRLVTPREYALIPAQYSAVAKRRR
jgi:hypothetical protein